MEDIFYKSKELNHLGLVSGMCDTLEISFQIDKKITQDLDQRNISIGTIVKALILNGLGFVQRSLYMVPHFFEDKPIELLLGSGITSSHLNDTVIGRALDTLYQYGTTKLFAELASHTALLLNLSTRFAHLDSTSFHLDGRYNSQKEYEYLSVIHLTQGYSRDHRPELNQVILNLIVDNQAGIPLHMEALSGNSSDKTTFRETIAAHIRNLQSIHGFEYTVADSALYSVMNLKIINELTHWISRVPETLKEVQELLTLIDHQHMTDLCENYRYTPLCSKYADIPQRWLLIWSKEAYQREVKTLNKNYMEKSQKEFSDFKQLCKQEFACLADAQKAYQEFKEQCKYIVFQDYKIVRIEKYKSKGRPSKQAVPNTEVFCIEANVACNIEHYRTKQRAKGMFVIATDELNCDKLSDLELFNAYKNQSKVEHGFRFLKDPQFAASTFFVEKPQRVEVLLMIMTLCLMVYAALEYEIRSRLSQTGTTLPNQIGKPTDKPTMRWIFQLFTGIHILYVKETKSIILNIKEIHKTILNLMGEKYQKYYLLI